MEDLHLIWPHRWISPKLKCFDSKIEGLGTFAVKDVKKGEIVVIVGGIIVPAHDIEKYRKKIGGHIGTQISEKFFICPTSIDELKRTGVFNHSCSPNIGFTDSITCIAIRKIKKGEEILLDYAFMETMAPNSKKIFFKCNCGSKNCRRIIRVDDWRRKDIQKKYGKYFSPYLKMKIKSK